MKPPAPARATALALFCLLCFLPPARADIVVKDDAGQEVHLRQPARRIISLSPNITELLYAAGAGDWIVGTVDYSDYPEAAKKIPRVGGYERIDLEAVAALRPDLVVGWQSGNLPGHIAKLKGLGIPVFLTEPRHMDDVARILEAIGQLVGTQAKAGKTAAELRQRLEGLRQRYAGQPPVRVFYQVWKQPLTTVNDQQIISDVIRLCGGINIFGHLPGLAPKVSVEAVLEADPEVIIASGMDAARPEWLDDWKQWPRLRAVSGGNLYFIPPDLIQRHTPRLLDGATQLCAQLSKVRARRQ